MEQKKNAYLDDEQQASPTVDDDDKQLREVEMEVSEEEGWMDEGTSWSANWKVGGLIKEQTQWGNSNLISTSALYGPIVWQFT